jgi:membrane-bound lytic murein transglycosylase D
MIASIARRVVVVSDPQHRYIFRMSLFNAPPAGRFRRRLAGATLCFLALIGSTGLRAADDAITRPPELERDVRFWIRVYTEVTTNEGFLHDEHNLGVVYQAVHFDPDAPAARRREQLDGLRDHYRDVLRRLAAGADDLTADEQRLRVAFGSEASPSRFEQAANEIRFQLGQADRFREGLVRSGAWEAHIADTLANLGLPPEISALPHVESSFNPAAYSKVGAAGLWQFMRSTGRRFLRIDDAVDERMDPFRATEAAAQLLDFNYRLLGTWPLALTAYNHGAAGMRRARDSLGTSDIVKIVRQHKSPTFGFASRNFYVSFLAALEIDRNPERYFGPIERRPETHFREVEIPAFVPVAALERVTKIDRSRLEALNPALLPAVWKGQRRVPQGYRLRLPDEGTEWTTEKLAARLAPAERYAGQPRPTIYRVRDGETLASIARAQGFGVEEIAALNGLKAGARLKTGRPLRLPESAPLAAVARAEPEPSKGGSPDESVYVVRSGDVLSDIATRVGVPLATLVSANQLKNPDSLYEGQRLRLAAGSRAEEAPTPAVVEKELLSERQAESRAAASADVTGAAIAQASDPVDYSVAADGSVRVAAAETLGHFADWLHVSAARLRELNGMKPSGVVVMGRKIRLDFAKVGKADFEQRRHEYHQQLQAAFFAGHRIVGTQIYVSRRGDSLWAVTQRFAKLPVWLLQQYNPDVDFSDLKSGVQIVVPKVEQVPVV